jgi:ABC-type multidrug transport system ATPase subunit
MYPHLTVYQTISFAARLRLPAFMSKEQKEARIDQVITELNLSDCKHTIIGGDGVKGISGGERKRVSIAIELITKPNFLFLDEPTSGLDSFTSFNVVEIMQKLVNQGGNSVIMTIHQPRTDILMLFDKIMLISKGKTIYFGSVQGALDHFRDAGYPCPSLVNPADWFLDLITTDRRSPTRLQESQERIEHLQHIWSEKEMKSHQEDVYVETTTCQAEDPIFCLLAEKERHLLDQKLKTGRLKMKLSWFSQFFLLIERNFIEVFKNVPLIIMVFVQSLIVMVLLGFTAFQIGLNQTDIQTRMGTLFFFPINTCFAAAEAIINVFPVDRQVITRERYASSYALSAFYLAKLISVLPLRVAATSIMATGLYFMASPSNDNQSFLMFFLFRLDWIWM